MKKILSAVLVLIMLISGVDASYVRDTSDWFAFETPDRTVMKGTALDASRLLDAPAGKHGFLKVSGDGLAFSDGTPARFWGTNIVGQSCFFQKESADRLVDIVTTSGYNMVRLHHLDSTAFTPNIYGGVYGDPNSFSRVEPDPEQLDKLHYLWSRLKENGVYMFLDFMGVRHLSYDDAIGLGFSEEKAEVLKKAPWAFTAIKYFDEDLQEIQKIYMRQLVKTVNPYTGLAIADDPAFAACCIANEDSLFNDSFFNNNIYYSTYFKNEVCGQFAEWLGTRYKDDTELADAWAEEGKKGVLSGDSIAGGYVYLDNNYYSAVSNQSAAKIRDIKAFLRFKQDSYYKKMKAYLRDELGVRAMISGSNTFMADSADELLTYSDSGMDISDQHAYYSGSVSGAKIYLSNGNPLGPDVFTPMLKVGSDDRNIITFCARRRLWGMPCFQSEWGGVIPNDYLADANYQMAAYGSLHGWNPVQFNLIQERWIPSVHALTTYYQTIDNPAYITTMTAAASMILGGHVSESTGGYYAAVSDSEAMTHEFFPEYPDGIEFVTKTGIAFSDVLSGEQTEKIAENNKRYEKSVKNKTFRSDTDELAITPESGVFTVNTDRTRLLAGCAENTEYTLGGVTLRFDNDYAAVCVTSLTDDRIEGSENILITATARCRNSGMELDDESFVTVSAGSAPVMMEPVEGTVKIKTSDLYELYVLSSSGERRQKINTRRENGYLVFDMKKEYKTNHYELVRTEGTADILNASVGMDYGKNIMTVSGSGGAGYGEMLIKCVDKYGSTVYMGKSGQETDGSFKTEFFFNGQSQNEYTITLKNETEDNCKSITVKAVPPTERFRMQNITFRTENGVCYADCEIVSRAGITDAVLLLTAYDAEGRLVSVNRKAAELSYGSNSEKIEIKCVPFGRYRLAVWKNNLTPLTDLFVY